MFSVHVAKEPGKTKKLLFDPFQQKKANFKELVQSAKETDFKLSTPLGKRDGSEQGIK
jgi:hypothetical protein